MSVEYFTFAITTADGRVVEPAIKCESLVSMMLLCPARMPREKIEHLMDLARATPGYPVDLTHFEGEGEEHRLVWSARIHYYGSAAVATDHWKCKCGSYMHHRLPACLTCGRVRTQ